MWYIKYDQIRPYYRKGCLNQFRINAWIWNYYQTISRGYFAMHCNSSTSPKPYTPGWIIPLEKRKAKYSSNWIHWQIFNMTLWIVCAQSCWCIFIIKPHKRTSTCIIWLNFYWVYGKLFIQFHNLPSKTATEHMYSNSKPLQYGLLLQSLSKIFFFYALEQWLYWHCLGLIIIL